MIEPEVPPTGESKSDLTVGGSAGWLMQARAEVERLDYQAGLRDWPVVVEERTYTRRVVIDSLPEAGPVTEFSDPLNAQPVEYHYEVYPRPIKRLEQRPARFHEWWAWLGLTAEPPERSGGPKVSER